MKPAPISRIIVLTPRLDGADGISEVSRQAVAACRSAVPIDDVEVWTLEGDNHPLSGGAIRSAEGRRSRMIAWGIAAAAGRADDVLVFTLHVHLLPVALPLALKGARIACFLHGVEAWRPLRRRERVVLSMAQTVLANSRWTADRFMQSNPDFSQVPVSICPLGVAAVAPRPEIPTDDGYALIVGRLSSGERYKGHDLLIDGWSSVLRLVPSAHLVIVGDGDDRGRLEQLARTRGVSANVIFTGRVSDETREGYYQNAAFFVMPSTGEGFGLAYLEAMRAGKPCIAAPGAASEIVEHEVTGLIVDPVSLPDLKDAIVRLFCDRDACRRMGAAARQRVAERFDSSQFTARLLNQLAIAPAAARV